MNRAIRCDIGNVRQAETCLPDSYVVSHNKLFFFNWGHVCVGCSDRGSFANPHLENFNSWYDPLHMIGGLRGIPLPAISYSSEFRNKSRTVGFEPAILGVET